MLRHDSQICDCGFHESLTKDPSNIFRPTERTCRVCGGHTQWARMHAEEDGRHDEANKNRAARDLRPSDGRHLGMRLVPESELAAERSAAAQQQPDQE